MPALAWLLVGAIPAAISLSALGYLAGSMLALLLLLRSPPLAQLGPCNLVTLLRLAMVSALLAPLAAPASTVTILTLALTALVLDGVDGWLARRLGHATDFGARFDMEVDAVFGLILALNAWVAGTVGAYVLLLGLPRYAFAAAGRRFPWIEQPLPERFGRKLVCVLQILALIALQLPPLVGPPATMLVVLTLAALAWSFGRDVLWLRRNGQ
ncbi:MAG: CDP-alcohol phosphatidyltransferase family protein [Halieaceae bacterium]|nr:CDP-alcohol phosphatidyltransferase family protein [Halieaceae bacterium]